MRVIKIGIENIKFNYTSYSEDLFNSVKRVGNSIPIRVNKIDSDLYEVIDGHKRCSIIKDLNTANIASVMIVNDHSCAGSGNWSSKNTH